MTQVHPEAALMEPRTNPVLLSEDVVLFGKQRTLVLTSKLHERNALSPGGCIRMNSGAFDGRCVLASSFFVHSLENWMLNARLLFETENLIVQGKFEVGTDHPKEVNNGEGTVS